MSQRASMGDEAELLRRDEQALARRRRVGIVLLLAGFAALAWWIVLQWTAVQGVKVEAPPPQAVEMLPPPPPPPPPPPEQVRPPEPTEQPAPVPNPEPQASEPKPEAAPVTIAGPAQAGTDSFGISAGSGGGIGAPGGTGTCLGTDCGGGGGGGGGNEAFYRQYLSSALQRRVQDNDRVSRLVFTAEFALTVSPGGTVTGVRLLRSSGKDDRDALLKDILEAVRGLNPPPAAMRFPQTVTVRGRRAL